MAEGLSRHDALHAIGTVLAEHMYDLLQQEQESDEDPNVRYFAELRQLTAAQWLARAVEAEPDDA